jgi:hypothetical protein
MTLTGHCPPLRHVLPSLGGIPAAKYYLSAAGAASRRNNVEKDTMPSPCIALDLPGLRFLGKRGTLRHKSKAVVHSMKRYVDVTMQNIVLKDGPSSDRIKVGLFLGLTCCLGSSAKVCVESPQPQVWMVCVCRTYACLLL